MPQPRVVLWQCLQDDNHLQYVIVSVKWLCPWQPSLHVGSLCFSQITQEQFILASQSLHLQRPGCEAVYPVGLYGWRKRCLYFFLLLLLVTMIVNLALTVWIMKVMNFSVVSTGGWAGGGEGIVQNEPESIGKAKLWAWNFPVEIINCMVCNTLKVIYCANFQHYIVILGLHLSSSDSNR